MFLFVASALAGTLIGWPCQRLNWGWRNVWNTCSIHAYAPSASAESLATIPTGFRFSSASAQPWHVLASTGVFTPAASAAPTILCQNGPATGTGASSALRNRCRRAVDAYGALVKSCQASPALGGARGPNLLATPDWAPSAGHYPHVENVRGLTQNAQLCLLPVGPNSVPNLNTPANTCPGLLGWFTVVFNACGFSNAPGLTPAFQQAPNTAPWTGAYFPSTPSTASINFGGVNPTATAFGPWTAGSFCTSAPPSTPSTPTSWNSAGPAFRTSRCRKALDQFGRTAQRCHLSNIAGTPSPAQAGGYSDPLRFLAVGLVPAGPASPAGLNSWTPLCN